jgi:hypothetical protein
MDMPWDSGASNSRSRPSRHRTLAATGSGTGSGDSIDLDAIDALNESRLSRLVRLESKQQDAKDTDIILNFLKKVSGQHCISFIIQHPSRGVAVERR